MELKEAERTYLGKVVRHKRQCYEFKIMMVIKCAPRAKDNLQFIFEPLEGKGIPIGQPQTAMLGEIQKDWEIKKEAKAEPEI